MDHAKGSVAFGEQRQRWKFCSRLAISSTCTIIPNPAMPSPIYLEQEQVIVLGEFGGLGLPIEGHTWQEKNNWGYQSFKTGKNCLTVMQN